jgi:23S rRNA (uracil1939-C5)-methyltransferase
MTEKTVTITALSTQGEGIGKVDGKVVFVPFTLPHEEWSVEITDVKKQYDRALPKARLSVSSPQPISREEPVCPSFGLCGGCQLQHIPYAEQLRIKREWLEETFQRLAHLAIRVNPVIASSPWQYRNKVTIPVMQENARYTLAYHKVNQPGELIPIQDCPIAHPLIREFLPRLLKVLNAVKPILHAYGPNQPGAQAQIRVIGERCYLSLLGMEIPRKKVESLIDKLFEPGSSLDEVILTEEKSFDTITITRDKEEPSNINPGSFLQVNDKMREFLYNYILDLPFERTESILDGYCGVGIITLGLLERFDTAVGVEVDESSAHDAQQQVEINHLGDRVQIHNQTIEQFLRTNQRTFDTLLLNPPRAGMSPAAREKILSTHPAEVVMVSCHPAAMVRDMRIFLEEGFEIQSVQPFDMFPQTYHLETVLHLKKPLG